MLKIFYKYKYFFLTLLILSFTINFLFEDKFSAERYKGRVRIVHSYFINPNNLVYQPISTNEEMKRFIWSKKMFKTIYIESKKNCLITHDDLASRKIIFDFKREREFEILFFDSKREIVKLCIEQLTNYILKNNQETLDNYIYTAKKKIQKFKDTQGDLALANNELFNFENYIFNSKSISHEVYVAPKSLLSNYYLRSIILFFIFSVFLLMFIFIRHPKIFKFFK